MEKETSLDERMTAIKDAVMKYEKEAFVFAKTIENLTLDYDKEVVRLRKELAAKKILALFGCGWWPTGILTRYEQDVKIEPCVIPNKKLVETLVFDYDKEVARLRNELNANKGEKTMKKETLYNYQAPVQTDVDQWSVFVRKIEDSVLVKVIEHKFTTEATAKAFAINNWNLGDY